MICRKCQLCVIRRVRVAANFVAAWTLSSLRNSNKNWFVQVFQTRPYPIPQFQWHLSAFRCCQLWLSGLPDSGNWYRTRTSNCPAGCRRGLQCDFRAKLKKDIIRNQRLMRNYIYAIDLINSWLMLNTLYGHNRKWTADKITAYAQSSKWQTGDKECYNEVKKNLSVGSQSDLNQGDSTISSEISYLNASTLAEIIRSTTYVRCQQLPKTRTQRCIWACITALDLFNSAITFSRNAVAWVICQEIIEMQQKNRVETLFRLLYSLEQYKQ